MGGADRDVEVSAYADVSDVTTHMDHDAPEELQIDTYVMEDNAFDATEFDEGRMTYDAYSMQRHREHPVLTAHDVELPEIYGLAERFVEQYPLAAVSSDVLQRTERRRLRRELEQRVDADMSRTAYSEAVDAALDTIDLGAAIDMDAFRDRVAIEVSTVYTIPVKDG